MARSSSPDGNVPSSPGVSSAERRRRVSSICIISAPARTDTDATGQGSPGQSSCALLAASRAAWTAGITKPISTAIIAMTTT